MPELLVTFNLYQCIAVMKYLVLECDDQMTLPTFAWTLSGVDLVRHRDQSDPSQLLSVGGWCMGPECEHNQSDRTPANEQHANCAEVTRRFSQNNFYALTFFLLYFTFLYATHASALTSLPSGEAILSLLLDFHCYVKLWKFISP